MVKPVYVRKVLSNPVYTRPTPAISKGGASFAGKGAAAAAGTWVWVPPGGSAVGKAAGKGGKGKKPLTKTEERLQKIDNSLKVWVGGLPEGTTWKQLEEHFATVVKPKVTDVMRAGHGVVAYDNAEDVETAIATLNGSELGGATIEVDVWVKKPKPEGERPERPKRPFTSMASPVSKGQSKGKKGKSPADAKEKNEYNAIDDSLKVWIGGLSPKTTQKELQEHLETAGLTPTIVRMMGRGKAGAAFDTADDAASVIAMLDSSELSGQVIQVDVWAKNEKGAKDEA
eukprot:TRINITY_DN15883_c0_g1_i1.p1 TRINITY_DN15883_c0_g1~~TRINITY_DN15883_c0_g1_i1.p1  ORF type:complete len:300 (-),score=75.02 TRINITY_DN15883_c0_g1_i1:119-973(-)